MALVLALCGQICRAASADSPEACDRQLRKTLEAVQAWRRLHQGHYPNRLADLKSAGLLGADDGICPDVLMERGGADPSHTAVTSRGEGGDPIGAYEYELANV